ncbi:hypothetical protein [Bradyrhizobium liaoningense]|uniref:hypothetical protein n=1 Tax=Bradyrhizobium liaoningense TaxID=43992 RepID=UPI001BAB2DB5|nr:hypothetical protein [Bradyrhizobium liaoningense]MBR0855466.1 hypothetical protein [Bradyrhizobium liaoningense]
MDIDDAIEAAAGDRDDQISADPSRAVSAERGIARARATIVRFLDACPDEFTVFELKELLDRQ